MADVFISYSQKTPEPTQLLARQLEALGYSVWWDTELLSGERFSAVILRELEAARAVVVIWTPASIHSEYVEDEASRAHRAGKLVATKTNDVPHNDIPLGFGRRHTISVDDLDGILRAIQGLGVDPSNHLAIATDSQPAQPPTRQSTGSIPLATGDKLVDDFQIERVLSSTLLEFRYLARELLITHQRKP